MRRLLFWCSVCLLCLLCGLMPCVSEAVTYHVAKPPVGQDSRDCPTAQNSSTPRETINHGILCLSSGDTLIVQNGIWDEYINDTGCNPGYTCNAPPGGSPGAYTTIKTQNVHGATLFALRNGGDFQHPIALDNISTQYIRIEGFAIDGRYTAEAQPFRGCASITVHNAQIVDIDCYGGGTGFIASGLNIEFIRIWSHDHGGGRDGGFICHNAEGETPEPGFCHGMYIQTYPGWPSDISITDSRFYNNNGYAIQSYKEEFSFNNNIFANNYSGGIIIIPAPATGSITNNCFSHNNDPPVFGNDVSCSGCTLSGNLFNQSSCPFSPNPPVATSLVFSQQPTGALVNEPFSVTVQIRDQFDNVFPSSALITLTMGANPGGGTLTGDTTQNAVNGTAFFPGLALTAAGSGKRLVASTSGLLDVTSNTFTISTGTTGNTWKVQKTGSSDGNPCTMVSPCFTINKGISVMSSGDLLIVGPGVYDELIADYHNIGGETRRPPPGTSWSAPTIIRSETLYGATIQKSNPPSGWTSIIVLDGVEQATQFISFEGFVLNMRVGRQLEGGSLHTTIIGDVPDIRFKDIKIDYPTQIGVKTFDSAVRWEFLNVDVTGAAIHPVTGANTCTVCGDPPCLGECHSYYMGSPGLGGTGHLWDGGTLDGAHGYGLQMYSSNTTVRNLNIKNMAQAGMLFIAGGHTIYNNTITGSGGGILTSAANNSIYSNTVHLNELQIQGARDFGIRVENSTGMQMKNNLVTQQAGNDVSFWVGPGDTTNLLIANPTFGGAVAGNLCDQAGNVGCSIISASPSPYVSAATGDFHLAAGSAAINTGVNLASPFNVDQDGNTRPDGNFDTGAFEFTTSTVPPAPTNLRSLSQVTNPDGTIRMGWNHPGTGAPATGFNVYRQDGCAGSFVKLTTQPMPLALEMGISMAGGEFGATVPGTFGVDYTYPDPNLAIDTTSGLPYAGQTYFDSKGFRYMTLLFRWERLQPTMNSALNTTEMNRVITTVNDMTTLGQHVILQPYCCAKRYVGGVQFQIGSPQVPISNFADFWSRMAQVSAFANNPLVSFDLMGEPSDTAATQPWFDAAQAAITAIRAAGANNKIMVEGNGFSHAFTWANGAGFYPAPNNGDAFLALTDPANNLVPSVQEFFDNSGVGTNECVSATIGTERMQLFTSWLRSNGKQGLLFAFGTLDTPTCHQVIVDVMQHIRANADVYRGMGWWGAGPWWPHPFPLIIDPHGGADLPQMDTLEPFLAEASAVAQTYTNANLSPGTTYCWRVTAVGPSGESAPSNVLSWAVGGSVEARINTCVE